MKTHVSSSSQGGLSAAEIKTPKIKVNLVVRANGSFGH